MFPNIFITSLLFLILIFILAEVLLRLRETSSYFINSFFNAISLIDRNAFHIMCIGESSTALYGKSSYPRQLENILNRSNLGVRFRVFNKGSINSNSTSILSNLKKNIKKYRPDLIVSMIGANDRFLLSHEDIPTIRSNFSTNIKILSLIRSIMDRIRFRKEGHGHIRFQYNLYDIVAEEENEQYVEVKVLKEKQGFDNTHNALNVALEYIAKAEPDKAEDVLKKSITQDTLNYQAYYLLGSVLLDQGRFRESVKMFHKSIKINPTWLYACYYKKAWAYANMLAFKKAINTFMLGIKLNPRNWSPHYELGHFYRISGFLRKAEKLFKKCIDIGGEKALVFLELGFVYRSMSRFKDAERMFNKAIEINPKIGAAYMGLALVYEDIGNHKGAMDYMEELKSKDLEVLNHLTHHIYHKIVDTIKKNKIRLICSQYPVSDIKILRRIFNRHWGVLMADNKSLFDQSLKENEEKKYFLKSYGKNEFICCTSRGNKMMAYNIAKIIATQFFNKELTGDIN